MPDLTYFKSLQIQLVTLGYVANQSKSFRSRDYRDQMIGLHNQNDLFTRTLIGRRKICAMLGLKITQLPNFRAHML